MKQAATAAGGAAQEDVQNGQRAVVVSYAAAAIGPTAGDRHVVLTLIDSKLAEPPPFLSVGWLAATSAVTAPCGNAVFIEKLPRALEKETLPELKVPAVTWKYGELGVTVLMVKVMLTAVVPL